LRYLVQYGDFELKNPGDDELIEEKKNRIEEIENIENYNENTELVSEIEVLNDEIDELEKGIDVYNLYYKGKYYDLLEFSILHNNSESKEVYAVGDYDDTNSTALRRAHQYIDDSQLENMDKNFISDYIDEEEFRDYFREGEEEYVRENLEDIFDEDDFEYEEEIQNRIDEIEELLDDSENLSQEQYDELNEELDELKNNEKTVSEDLIERKVEEMLDDKSYDIIGTCRDYGIELSRFVNEDELAQGMVDADGFGHTINSYNGNEDDIVFDEETYYIFQIEG
jgi:hypothetical protein